MKKLTLILGITVVWACSSQAAYIDRIWNFADLFEVAPTLTSGEVDGDGAGWFTEIYDQTDTSGTAGNTTSTLGWVSPVGYLINPYNFTATENDSVALRLYNATTIGAATYFIDSAYVTLSDLDDVATPSVGALDVNFDFTSSTWQAVPEPATFLLFGMGAMGAWLVRRNKLKSTEEA